MAENTTITVDRKALYTVLQALVGPGHLIRELQFTRSLHKVGHPNPIEILIEQFEAGGVQAMAQGVGAGSFEQSMSEWAHGDAQDAARYRWLRKSPNPACDIALAKHFGGGRGQDFDALIDAAIAAQAKQGGADHG